MTIGQRIANCRKQLGISQEALGEKLDVSRQAISKWEGDAALPEIDKLIALSRLFGVTVGWLLGVEEPVPQEQDPLTQEQLNAMEQLIKLYTTRGKSAPKPDRRPLILSALALVLAAAALLSCLSHHTNLSNSLGNLSYQQITLMSDYESLRSQMSQLQSADIAREIPDALHRFSFHLTPDTEEPKVLVQLSAIPKQHANETAVLAVRRNGQDVAFAECTWDGTAYVAKQELPLENGYEYWLMITDPDGTQEQIPLADEQAENLTDSFSLSCQIEGEKVFLKMVDGDFAVNGLMFRLQRPISMEDGGDYLWDSIELRVIQNGEKTHTYSFLSADSDLTLRRSVLYETSCAVVYVDPPIRPEEGDGFEVWLVAKVSNGMECKEMVGAWGYEAGTFLRR